MIFCGRHNHNTVEGAKRCQDVRRARAFDQRCTRNGTRSMEARKLRRRNRPGRVVMRGAIPVVVFYENDALPYG